ncbi:MAG: glycosyl transferase [Burkholderiales bacterium]|nr:glycosyl transferase [Anaerolineae bacterium]
MSKIAYIGLPAHGHTNPTLPVVQELIQHGHDVLYYNAESFRTKVAPTGVDFRAYPEPMPTEREVAQAIRELIDASLLLSGLSEQLTPFMLAEIERERPDLILYDTTAMWGYLAARKYHIPHICSVTHFVLNGSQGVLGRGFVRFLWSAIPHLPKLIRWKRRMKQRYGSIVGGITEYADLNLVFTSKEFHPANIFIDGRWRGRFRFVGPSIKASTRDKSDFPFEQLNGERLVYISLGTINNLDLGFYRAAFAAFADYPAQFILSVGKNTDIAQLGEIPANFIVRPYVPQLEILQRVDAFITHGGMNSVHEGLYYGVPEVVVPHQLEQLLNAKRVAATGASVVLGEQYPYGRVTAAELREELNKVLADSSYRQHASQMGETLKAAGGYLQAVAEIEGFLETEYRVQSTALQVLSAE